MNPSLPDLRSLWSLTGRRAFVTGGTRGIGWTIVRYLAAAGAEVVFTGRDAVLLDQRKQLLRSAGLHTDVKVYDVTDEAAAVAAVEGEVELGLDILVNNAGIAAHESLTLTTTKAWEDVLSTNLTAAFVHARAAAPALKGSSAGRIINIGSLWSTLGKKRIHAYTAAKHGLSGLSKTLAAELGEYGVTVNTIAPGYIVTPMNEERAQNPAFDRLVRERAVLGRWGQPEDIAAAALFLASPGASYITGQLLGVDGGTTNLVCAPDTLGFDS